MPIQKTLRPARKRTYVGDPGRNRRRLGVRRGGPAGARPGRVPGRRRLKVEEIERIVMEIRAWNHSRAPLTWEAVQDLAEGLFLHRWTRQALEGRAEIKGAFQDGKATGPRKVKRTPRDPVLVLERRRIEALEEEVKNLKAKLAAYEERFARYVVNAMMRNVTEAELDERLQPNDRGQTDPKLKGGVR